MTALPRCDEIPEPRLVVLVHAARAGTKLFQSFIDGHPEILMVPGYPLMYLYPHWDLWQRQYGAALTWPQLIDLFCEKHASVIDSRAVRGLSGLDRLGAGDEALVIDGDTFRRQLAALLEGLPIRRRTFFLAVHYAYGVCTGRDPRTQAVLFFHAHHPPYVEDLAKDFPDLRVIDMVRLPVASLPSTARALAMVDEQKLNATDAAIVSTRAFRLANMLEFDELHRLAAWVPGEHVVAVRLEDVHADLEGTMRRIAAWMGVGFDPCMLDSTFGGKRWLGDVTNVTPVSGPDPNAMSDKWRKALDPLDQYVIEGACHRFYATYGYEQERYRADTPFQRLKLRLAALLPMGPERRALARLLAPAAHGAFLRAAYAEACGNPARKDYTWNGTYLFKWTYVDLELWRPGLHDRVLAAGLQAPIAASLYTAIQYLRYWGAILTMPVEILRRRRLQLGRLDRRCHAADFLPQPLAAMTSGD